MKLIFASNNKGKIKEVQSLVNKGVQIVSLGESGIIEEIPEPFLTFRENAWAKASFVAERTKHNCFAEDSGLVVPALDGNPGVFSARYAGVDANDENNNAKLLVHMKDIDDRYCYYQAVICLFLDGTVHYFEGKCEGRIIPTPRGEGGFGYDPLFVPKGYDQTFGELALMKKNKISHRAEAMGKLLAFLNQMT